MEFSEAQFQATIDKIAAGTTELSGLLQKVGPTAQQAVDHWYVPGPIKEAVMWLAQQIVEQGQHLLDTIAELLRGALAPIYMFRYAWEWQDVRGLATGVSGDLQPGVLSIGRQWQGRAATAYAEAIEPQAKAAAHIGTIADKTATALAICATAGLAFYVALGVILVKFIATTITAIAALGSVVFSGVGAGLIVEEAGVNAGLIYTALGTLGALLGAQASQMIMLHGEAGDGSAFSAGQWPRATTDYFSDATVMDGDADWSIRR